MEMEYMATQKSLENVNWVEVDASDVEMWTFPDDGTTVEGQLLQVDHDVGAYHSNLYHIETKNGIVGVWGNTVLDRRFNNIDEGAVVKIVYKGEKHSEQSGRTYKNFAVYTGE